jgi:hypothetical protein
MLVTDRGTFLHIPKTGGTSIRRALLGREVSEVLPMGEDATARHRFHWIGRDRPEGTIFTVVRHPADWMSSYWKMRRHEGALDPRKRLDQLWCDDMSRFAEAVIDHASGYVSRMFAAYAGAYESVTVYRLEDGLGHITGARENVRHGSKISGELRRRIEAAESQAMEAWY